MQKPYRFIPVVAWSLVLLSPGHPAAVPASSSHAIRIAVGAPEPFRAPVQDPPPPPDPDNPTPDQGGEPEITGLGLDRLTWEQPASSAEALVALRFTVFVDDIPVVLAPPTCTALTATEFACETLLPPLAPGRRILRLEASRWSEGQWLQSESSDELAVNVTGRAGGT